MARKNIEYYASWIKPDLALRYASSGRIYDVYYDKFVSDPIGTLRGIYDHFGLVWPDFHEKRLHAYIQKNPRDKYGKHHYKSEDFGMTDKIVNNYFTEYIEKFGFN
jgi:hypothetical protein